MLPFVPKSPLVNVIIIVLCLNLVKCISKHPILIVVSYDAFRYDFLTEENVPYMKKLQQKGTYSDYLVSVFPTKTFPNHQSIATGLYAESHGVVGNNFYDPSLKKILTSTKDEAVFLVNQSVPIYRYNEDLGDERYSGLMMWPGGIYPYEHKNVTRVVSFEEGYKWDWHKIVDTVISWITDPDKPTNLVMIYNYEPDEHLHSYGPNSKVLKGVFEKLDDFTKYLDTQLTKNHLQNKANVIHLSDHGISAVKYSNILNVTQYLTPGTYQTAESSPLMHINPKKGFEDEIYSKLKTASIKNGHFQVFKKNELLERWHFKNNSRIPPILVVANTGYALDDLIKGAVWHAGYRNFTLTNDTEFGVHGYDNTDDVMHPFFMARGPSIKVNHKVPPFNNVDLFSLFCLILNIPQRKTNGTVDHIRDILVDYKTSGAAASPLLITGVPTLIIWTSFGMFLTGYFGFFGNNRSF